MAKKKIKKPTLDKIIFVTFYEALDTGDFSKLNVDEDYFLKLKDEFYSILIDKKDPLIHSLERIEQKIELIKGCIHVLAVDGYDEQTVEILKTPKLELNFGFKLISSNNKKIIDFLKEAIIKLNDYYEMIDGEIPKPPKSDKLKNGYDALATLSVSLDFNIGDFNKITVLGYISYFKANKDKQAQLKEQQNNLKNKNGR